MKHLIIQQELKGKLKFLVTLNDKIIEQKSTYLEALNLVSKLNKQK